MPPHALPQLQDAFQGFLLRTQDINTIATAVVSDAKGSASRRLDIYAYAYRARLSEALEQDFEALHTLLGDDQFHSLCHAYVQLHPSQHFSLRYLGQHMAAFLRAHDLYQQQPVLAELAAFEWAMTEAFDAADTSVIRLDDLAGLTAEHWGDLRFSIHPSVQRLELTWNAPAIWNAVQQELAPPPPQGAGQPVTWLVWRQELKTWFRSLPTDEAWAWQAAYSDHSFAEICDGLCRWLDEDTVPAAAACMLQRWINDGLISSIRCPAR
ncbi:MAG: DNA-binding domain-containing protein [Gammaproteobacteria bacterium]|nr:DNA-binding domain-containing protein [Gammaproteobacteria bacterium]